MMAFHAHWTRLACEGAVLRFDCYDFYKLGLFIHPLTELSDGAVVPEVLLPILHAKTEINGFYQMFSLKTSRNPATALYQAMSAVVPDDLGRLQMDGDDGKPRKLSEMELDDIRTAAKEFETVLKAELSSWDSLFVSQKGAFSTPDLISQAELMIPEASRVVLDQRQLLISGKRVCV